MNFKQNQQMRVANGMLAMFIVEITKLVKDPEAKDLYDKVQEIYKTRKKEWDRFTLLSTYVDRSLFKSFEYVRDPIPTDETVQLDIVKMASIFMASIPEYMRRPVDKKVKKKNSGIIS